jgi:hypothetical protein
MNLHLSLDLAFTGFTVTSLLPGNNVFIHDDRNRKESLFQHSHGLPSRNYTLTGIMLFL